jgi:DNA-directed RNA polymerase specialized sigma24 family protein
VLNEELQLVLQERCTYREAAARLGLPPGEVAARIRAGLRELRQSMLTASPTASPPVAVTEA